MIRALRFTPEAEADLTEIFWFIASDDPLRARRYIDKIRQSCRTLCDTPLMGRERSDLRPGTRILPLWRRIIIAYDVHGESVDIIRIFSSGQDYEAIMAGR